MIVLSNGEKHEFCKKFIPDVSTIAFALSHINRYTGHVGSYSVAQHSVIVSRMLPDDLKLAGLLHDATEAYLGDVSSPLKALLPEYKKIEAFYHSVIDDYFGIDTGHPLIKEADLRTLITEAKSFGIWCDEFPKADPYDFKIEPVMPSVAFSDFMREYNMLTNT